MNYYYKLNINTLSHKKKCIKIYYCHKLNILAPFFKGGEHKNELYIVSKYLYMVN